MRSQVSNKRTFAAPMKRIRQLLPSSHKDIPQDDFLRIIHLFVALHRGSSNVAPSFNVYFSDLEGLGRREFCRLLRTELYSRLGKRPRPRGSSSDDFLADFEELRREVKTTKGFLFSALSLNYESDPTLDKEVILDFLSQVAQTPVRDCSNATADKMMLLVGILLADNGQYLDDKALAPEVAYRTALFFSTRHHHQQQQQQQHRAAASPASPVAPPPPTPPPSEIGTFTTASTTEFTVT